MQPEKILHNKIISELRKRKFYAVKQEGLIAGWPDIYATNGRSFHIEVKVGDNQATKIQMSVLKKLAARGAKCCVIRNLHQLIYFIEEMRNNVHHNVFWYFPNENLKGYDGNQYDVNFNKE